MINNHMIEVKQDLDSLTYDTGIEIKVISENFDNTNRFSKLTSSQYDAIMMADTSLNRESILMAFLYINSYIITRKRDNNGNEISDKPQESPEAFYRSIESMVKELSMSKDTINQCIGYLTTSSKGYKSLLVKREVGSVKSNKNKPPKNIPNIYVLNKDGYTQEIEWALKKMLELYKVDKFISNNRG